MNGPTIVVIEDEADLRELLEHNLGREGYATAGVGNGIAALELVRQARPDLVLLDLIIPGIDGFEVCRRLKMDTATRDIPVIMLTARGEEGDIVLGLEIGAEDYVTKPFGWRELMARIRSALRRPRPTSADPEADPRGPFEVDGVRIDSDRHEVRVDGQAVPFTRTEFAILHALASQPGRAFARRRLMVRVGGEDVRVQDRNVDVHVRSIRRKLGDHAELVETVRGIGYRFRDPEIDR